MLIVKVYGIENAYITIVIVMADLDCMDMRTPREERNYLWVKNECQQSHLSACLILVHPGSLVRSYAKHTHSRNLVMNSTPFTCTMKISLKRLNLFTLFKGYGENLLNAVLKSKSFSVGWNLKINKLSILMRTAFAQNKILQKLFKNN